MGKDRGGGGGKQKLRPPNGPDSPALPYSSSQPERVEPTASTSHSKPPNFIPNPKKPRNPNWVSRNRRGPLVKQQFVKKSEVGSSNDQVGSGRIVETATGQQEEHEEKEEEEEKERIAIGVGVAGEDVGASESRKSHEDDDYDVVSRLEELQLGVQEPELSDEQLRINDQAQADELLAMESIYGDHFCIFERQRDLRSFQIHIHIEAPGEIAVTTKLNSSDHKTRSNSSDDFSYPFNVQHLPPIILTCILPKSYPSHLPPYFSISVQWLDSSKISNLCSMLDSIWTEQSGQEVMYQWVEWLQNSSLSYLGFDKEIILGPYGVRAAVDRRAVTGSVSPDVDIPFIKSYNDDKLLENFHDNLHECCICFSEYAGTEFIRLPCRHFFCGGCMKTYSNIHVKEGTVHKLQCPDAKCGSMIPPGLLKRLLGDEEFERWDSLMLTKTLESMSDVVYCSRCETPCIADEDQHAQCVKCFFSFCTLCRERRHVGVECMTPELKLRILQERQSSSHLKDDQKRKELEMINEVLSVREILRDAKQCPSCKMAISKTGGCNKMVCENCGHYFCYRCDKEIDGYDHFRDGECELFPQEEIRNWEAQMNPRQVLGQIQAQLFVQNGQVCPNCRQFNAKIGNNNHMFCWACQNHYCYLCKKIVRRGSSVLPSLRLSYHYLPTYLKRCFAYCSIFPKDYEFEKENVIPLWMAEGLIPHAENEKAMEEVGERYFDELLLRSLFQRPRLDRPSFTMHDLTNDLAMFVSGKFCFRLEQKNSHEVPDRVRHLSYMRGRFDTSSKFEPLEGVKCLRTFLPVSLAPYKSWEGEYVSNKVLDDLLPAQKYLRAFSLSIYRNITHLPDSIGNHIHLRYIDLSYTRIKRLPDTVCSLYNLQTLLLKGCSSLVELPAEMRRLIHLRHLDIGGTKIKEMPVHMGRLKSLRTLTAFVLGKSTGSSIAELRELSHLGGKISILNLQNAVGAIDALLKDKKDLKEVELAWGPAVSDDSVKERHVLERLQPWVNLVKLTIKRYGGTSFPNWVGDSSFSNLQVMRLIDCGNCISLPPVGQLPALKELYVERMKSVVSVGVELYGGNQQFQCLEKLEFWHMPEWEEWQPSPSGGESPNFPCLKELKLIWCPKLRGNLPTHLPSLKILWVLECKVLHENRASNTLNTESLRGSLEELRIKGCPGLSLLLESTETLPSLRMFNIYDLGGREWLPQMVHNSNRLQSLTLYVCSSLLSFPTNGLPTTLTSLQIHGCRKLEFLSREMMAKLTSLRSLDLMESCDSLRSFPLGIFPNLSSLSIDGCENLESLSVSVEGGADENLSHLNSLSILFCPNLVSFPNLTSFSVGSLKLLPDRMHTLTALERLTIFSLPNVVSFAQGGLPPNLQSFWIEGNKDLVETLLNEQLLPATLHTLEIKYVSNLKSLDGKGFEHLTSLQHLQIEGCESLEFLPKEGFPASLSYVSIRDCPCLKKGKDWSNIARIPCIDIDGEITII